MGFINDETLVLPGHNEPFQGGHIRLNRLAQHHNKALEKLKELARTPICVADTFPVLFSRKIDIETATFAIMEARAHINHLLRKQELREVTAREGASDRDWYEACT